MTEPEKMRFPYMESIIASLSFCDEVVIVLGRSEEISERKIENLKRFFEKDRNKHYATTFHHPSLKREIKVIKTNAWPEKDWHYDTMKEHLQLGLDSCTGDLCIKMDADHVFRDQHADLIRKVMTDIPSTTHWTSINMVHYYTHRQCSFRSYVVESGLTNCYIINKKKLAKEGLTCKILNDTGSHKPYFFDNDSQPFEPVLAVIGDVARDFGLAAQHAIREVSDYKSASLRMQTYVHQVCPINYSYTFDTKGTIAKYWARWHSAFCKKGQKTPAFDVADPQKSLNHFVRYHWDKKKPKTFSEKTKSIPEGYTGKIVRDPDTGLRKWFTEEPIILNDTGEYMFPLTSHPSVMQPRLMTIDSTMWGYDNFEDHWREIENGPV